MTEQTDSNSIPASTRRAFLRRAGIASFAAAAAPAAASLIMGKSTANAAPLTDIDVDVLTFALNLEYLEAEYYSYAFYGVGIENQVDVTGTGTVGTTIVKPSPQVKFGDAIVASYAEEITNDEINHVKFLRAALLDATGEVIARPPLDLLNSFNNAAAAAGIGPAFDPFAGDVSFLTGAFIFEDVGVTAYHGAAALITNPAYLTAAAGILAVEAYHASNVRTALYARAVSPGGTGIADTIQKISDLRDSLDGGSDKDQGIIVNGKSNIVPTDANSIAYGRSTKKVLQIVYGARGVHAGGFFPNGLNGNIK